MPHTIKDQKRLLTRVRRIKGQTEALERALQEKVDCGAILQQIAAVRGAINGLMAEVLEGHIREHLGVETTAKQREKDVEETINVLRSYLK